MYSPLLVFSLIFVSRGDMEEGGRKGREGGGIKRYIRFLLVPAVPCI